MQFPVKLFLPQNEENLNEKVGN